MKNVEENSLLRDLSWILPTSVQEKYCNSNKPIQKKIHVCITLMFQNSLLHLF